MTQALAVRIASKRRFLPLTATGLLFLIAYGMGALAFPAMRDGQAFFNLLVTTPFLLIAVVGQTFVIISGGIDLSVSGVIALTTVASAALIQRPSWVETLCSPVGERMMVMRSSVTWARRSSLPWR